MILVMKTVCQALVIIDKWNDVSLGETGRVVDIVGVMDRLLPVFLIRSHRAVSTVFTGGPGGVLGMRINSLCFASQKILWNRPVVRSFVRSVVRSVGQEKRTKGRGHDLHMYIFE